MSGKTLLAGIDAGGTTFKLGVAEAGGPIVARARVPTTDPDTTISETISRLRELSAEAGGTINRLGIASFGPVDVDPSSDDYGTILRTPKPGWTGTRLLDALREGLGCRAFSILT